MVNNCVKHSRADYYYVTREIPNGNIYLIIYDMNEGNISVTNDMENVLFDIFIETPRLMTANIIYKDSEGVFDGVRLTETSFEFYPLRKKFESYAIRKAELVKSEV